jgi:hypothetical protein
MWLYSVSDGSDFPHLLKVLWESLEVEYTPHNLLALTSTPFLESFMDIQLFLLLFANIFNYNFLKIAWMSVCVFIPCSCSLCR